jgi:hypothetical protein
LPQSNYAREGDMVRWLQGEGSIHERSHTDAIAKVIKWNERWIGTSTKQIQ